MEWKGHAHMNKYKQNRKLMKYGWEFKNRNSRTGIELYDTNNGTVGLHFSQYTYVH